MDDMKTTETRMTGGWYIKTTTALGAVRRVEVCRRGVILAFADSTEAGIVKAQALAAERGLDHPTVK